MSIELDQEHPNNNLKFAFRVSGKRITVRVSDELYHDVYQRRSRADLVEAIYDELKSKQSVIIAEYDSKNTPEKNPSYTLTTQGLI